jgi:hypothetical protein
VPLKAPKRFHRASAQSGKLYWSDIPQRQNLLNEQRVCHAKGEITEMACKSSQPRPRGQDGLLREVGCPSETGQCLTQKPNAGCWGWLVPDKLVGMMICKVSYPFCRSLPHNDEGTL